MTTLTFIFFFFTAPLRPDPTLCDFLLAGDPLTVCEALAQIDRIQDQIVTIEGLAWQSSHGITLNPRREVRCEGLPLDRQSWVQRIAIDSPRDTRVRRERIPQFDDYGYHQLVTALEGRGGECTVILVGEIRFRPDAWFKVRDGEVVGGGGYGQMGRLPAQLVVRDFLGIVANEQSRGRSSRACLTRSGSALVFLALIDRW